MLQSPIKKPQYKRKGGRSANSPGYSPHNYGKYLQAPEKIGQTYTPASVKPGVKHTIEGRENVSWSGYRYANREQREAANPGLGLQTIKDRMNYKEKTRGYRLEDEARSRIKPILDPDADSSSKRRKAAQRKTKGRMGTILSQGQGTQTLGAKGTVG